MSLHPCHPGQKPPLPLSHQLLARLLVRSRQVHPRCPLLSLPALNKLPDLLLPDLLLPQHLFLQHLERPPQLQLMRTTKLAAQPALPSALLLSSSLSLQQPWQPYISLATRTISSDSCVRSSSRQGTRRHRLLIRSSKSLQRGKFVHVYRIHSDVGVTREN